MKPFIAADILLPGEQTDMTLWAALACDQFTSQPDYWQRAEALTAGAPSTLHITLPEIYLGRPDTDARIAAIHETMRRYQRDVLTRTLRGFVYVERTTQNGVRQGLVGTVDLEAYSYERGCAPLVRPSERTVAERIPPRLAVRRGAPLETPHILMLIDDAARAVIEPLAAKKAALAPLYDTELMLGGGHVSGWAVTDAADCAAIESAVAALGSQESFDSKYPGAAGRPPLAVAVGDGNHSLATAKAYWEELKPTLPPAERETHPARWCLAELVNIHSPAILIEPIHRVVTGTSCDELAAAFRLFLAGRSAEEKGTVQRFTFFDSARARVMSIPAAPGSLAAETIECFLQAHLDAHPELRVDYIHGEDNLRSVVCEQTDAVGIQMPPIDKDTLLMGVALGGVLPKKAFSMGHAEEKRYYLECRAIAPQAL